MKLSRLIQALDTTATERTGDGDPDIGAICCRAQQVGPGDLFVAIQGFAADGHDFIDQALDRGAAALVVQQPTAAPVPVVRVENTRIALAALSARFYGEPSEAMTIIGITGTNGKTTTAYLVEGILAAAGFNTGLIGTIDYRFAGTSRANPMTTPESLDLQRILAEMRRAGVTHVVMEVSSHAVDLHRIHGCRFRLGVLTNLTQDHLDHHGTMERYWACKKRFFTDLLTPQSGRIAAVVNADDPRGEELARDLALPLLRVGGSPDADIKPESVAYEAGGTRASVHTPDGSLAVTSTLVGRHNLENILCAMGVGSALDLPPDRIIAGIAAVDRVPGRLEPVANTAGRSVYVDYAHTPDALDHALKVLRDLPGNRLICVFGCGGDRDRTKRPLMGEIAGRGADLTVITSDNPRSENPAAIIGDILAGLEGTPARRFTEADLDGPAEGPGYFVEADRRRAIARAVAASRPGDRVLVAGKGHETYQIVGDTVRDFDDGVEARAALAALEKNAAAEA